MILCEVCGTFYDQRDTDSHIKCHERDTVLSGLILVESVAKNRLETFAINNPLNILDLTSYLNWIKPYVKEKLTGVYLCSKVNMVLDCKFFKNGQYENRRFKTKNEPFFNGSDSDGFLERNFNKLLIEREACDFKGSGWTFICPVLFELRKNAFFPMGLNVSDSIH